MSIGDGTTVVGESVRRVEDHGLLTGATRYTADLQPDGLLHAQVVRSPVAHARITSIDTGAAAEASGVVAVFTAADLAIQPLALTAMAGPGIEGWERPVLASDVVRFVGEMVALVVADSTAHATDAAELVEVDYDPLDVVIGIERALDPSSTPLFPSIGGNVVASVPFEGIAPGREDERHAGTRSVTVEIENHRMAVVPMEGNAITVVPEADGRLTAWVSTQYPHMVRDYVARALGLDSEAVRVRCAAVGGGFGGKGPMEPEYALVAAAAQRLERPVQFAQTRTENLLTMQSRGHRYTVTMTATDDGILTHLHVDHVTDAGAYPGMGCVPATTTRSLAAGPYRVPQVRFDIRAVATNTAPTGPFRGAGRESAAHLLERTIEVLAAELGTDSIELRRRNLIGPDEFAYESPMGVSYDSGDYELVLDTALERAGYEELRREQQDRRASGDGPLLGIGVCLYVEMSGAGFMGQEFGSVRIDAGGTVQLLAGTRDHGQGHATVFAQIVSEVLGIPVEHIELIDNDTDVVPSGRGTASSRSAQVAGSALKAAAEEVLERARKLAADELEAAPADIVVVPGKGLGVTGVPTAVVPWARVVAIAAEPLVAAPGFAQEGGTAPFGCHVAVVEVDPETGAVALRRIVAVDDCGTVLNPLLAEGQVHGGVYAGIAQALFEEMRYDEDGNPLTTTLADYLMPSAADLPSYEAHHTVTPSPRNPLGAKGLGEAGTCGALTAVHNAVVDAVAHLGIRHLDLPLTPERVWSALVAAGTGA